MSDSWLRRIAWGAVFVAVVILIISVLMLFLAPDHTSSNWFDNQISAFMALGAPILGLVIVIRQPHQRIGWLWIIYGFAIGLRTAGHAVYYFNGSQFTGYSALEYFLLWSTEPANLTTLVCLILLLLWFPSGKLASSRWRFIYIWLFLAVAVLSLSLFIVGPNWNGGENAGGVIIDNPYGWLSADLPFPMGFSAFVSIVLIFILTVLSLILRYRSAGQLVRLQLRWFVLGGCVFICLDILPALFIDHTQIETGLDLLLRILGNSSIAVLYIAVGVAILRYRLYDIDLIIRRTLQYALLTGLLALIYFGSVVLLQTMVENLAGEQSPIVVVISTLVIAALFNPLRYRVQDFIDRRFYRKKYNAEQTLSGFADIARDEVELEGLQSALLALVGETMQPMKLSLMLPGVEQSQDEGTLNGLSGESFTVERIPPVGWVRSRDGIESD